MKRLICIVLCIVMMSGIFSITAYAEPKAYSPETTAEELYKLGLFRGVGTDQSGKPNFSLNATATRQEAVVMLIRLLGKENEALSGNYNHPFIDVDDWASPYIGYAYTNGLSNGTSATTFSGNTTVTSAQFLTLILRALGYESGVDFIWSDAVEYAHSIGIRMIYELYSGKRLTPIRQDLAWISYWTLLTYNKSKTETLITSLYRQGVLTLKQVQDAGFEYYIKMDSLNDKYHKDFRHVPDFGKIVGIEPLKVYGNNTFVYDGTSEAYTVTEYGYLLQSCGFERIIGYEGVYQPLYYNENGNLKEDLFYDAYKNEATGDMVFTTAIFSESNIYYVHKINAPITTADISEIPNQQTNTPPQISLFYSDYPSVPTYDSVTSDSLATDGGQLKIYNTSAARGSIASDNLNDYISHLKTLGFKDEIVTSLFEYKDSRLVTTYGTKYLLTSPNGLRIEAIFVRDSGLSVQLIFLKFNSELKDRDIHAYIGSLIADKNSLTPTNAPYMTDSNNYEYGNADTIYGNTIYQQKATVKSTQELLRFLQAKYKCLYTPVEDFNISIEIWDNSSASTGQGSNIHVDFSYVSPSYDVISPLNFASKYGYSYEQKTEAVELLKKMMQDICRDATDIFPNASIVGSLYTYSYTYPHIRVGYSSSQTLSWSSLGGFHWEPSLDEYSILG